MYCNVFTWCCDNVAERLRRQIRNLLCSHSQVRVLPLSLYLFISNATNSVGEGMMIDNTAVEDEDLLLGSCFVADEPFSRRAASLCALSFFSFCLKI